MPFIALPKRNLRVFARINNSTEADDNADARSFIDPAKPCLFLFHSPMSSGWCFQAQFKDPRLLNAFNLVALDSRFCGRTESKIKKKFTLEDAGEDAVAAMKALSLSQPSCLLGQGFLGANIATWIAIKEPKMVRCMLLASPGPLECAHEVSTFMKEEWLPLALSNKNAGTGTGEVPQAALEVLKHYYFGEEHERQVALRDAFLEDFERRYGKGHGKEELSLQAEFFQRKMIAPKLRAKVTCPVLILRGSEDKATSPASAAQEWSDGFTAVKGGAQVHTMVGAPHLLLFFDSNIATRITVQFCKRSLA